MPSDSQDPQKRREVSKMNKGVRLAYVHTKNNGKAAQCYAKMFCLNSP